MDNQPEFRTADILLASVLHLHYVVGYVEQDAAKQYFNPRTGLPEYRFQFVFKDSPELRQTLQAWNKNNIMVDPKRFYAAFKQLKFMTMSYSKN